MRLVCLLLLAASCRCAPSPLPEPFSRVQGPQVLLSVVRPVDGAGCVWERREEPSRKVQLLARLPGPCSGVRTALDDGRTQGLVELQRPLPDGGDGWVLYQAALDGGEAHALPMPPDGELDDFGFDASGRARACTVQPLADAAAKSAPWRGGSFEVPDDLEGAPALAHGWTFDAGAWRHDETKVVGLDDDGDRSDGFAWEEGLGPRSFTDEALPDDDDPAWVKDESLGARLDLAVGRDAAPGRWLRLETVPAAYDFVSEAVGETRTLTTDDGASAVALFSSSDATTVLRVDVHGGFLLATPEADGSLLVEVATHAVDREFVPGAWVDFWPSR